MRAALVGSALVVLALGLGLTDAEAAMCGRTCLGGGRHIPGPPEVCAAAGLAYCGPSRERRDEKHCTTTRIVRPDGTTITKRSCD